MRLTKWLKKTFPIYAVLFSGIGVWVLDLIFVNINCFASIWTNFYTSMNNGVYILLLIIFLLTANISLTIFLIVDIKQNHRKGISSATECTLDILCSERIISKKVTFSPNLQGEKR